MSFVPPLLLALLALPVQIDEEESHGSALRVQVGHSSRIGAAVFTWDGRFLFTAPSDSAFPTEDRYPIMWDAASGREIARLETFDAGFISTMAVSPQGLELALGTWEGGLYIADRITQEAYPIGLESHASIIAAAFDENGDHVRVLDMEGTVRTYDLASYEESEPEWSIGYVPTDIEGAKFSWEGGWLLAADDMGNVRLWDTSAREEVVAWEIGAAEICVQMAFDGSWLAACTDEGDFWMWSGETFEPVAAFNISQYAGVIRVSPDGELFLAFDEEGWGSAVWSVQDGEQLETLPGSPLAFSPMGDLILTTPAGMGGDMYDNTVLLTDVSSGVVVGEMAGLVNPLSQIAVSPDGGEVLVGDIDGALYRWNASYGAMLDEGFLESRVTSLDYSANGLWFAASSESFEEFYEADLEAYYAEALEEMDEDWGLEPVTPASTTVWDRASHEVILEVPGRLALLLDSGQLVTGDAEGTIRAFDIPSGEVKREVNFGERAWALKHSEDEQVLAVCLESGSTLLLDMSSFEVMGELYGFDVDFGNNGAWVAACGTESVIIYDSQTGETLHELPPAEFVRLSPTGELIAFAVYSAVVVVGLDGIEQLGGASYTDAMVEGPEDYTFFDDHFDLVVDLDFSPDGRLLYSASSDGTVCVHDVVERRLLARLVSFHDRTWAVMDAEGRYDASNGGDVEGLHWVFGEEVVHLDELKDVFYNPGLLTTLLAPEAAADDELLEIVSIESLADDLHPSVSVLDTPIDENTPVQPGGGKVRIWVNGDGFVADPGALRVKLTDRGGGFGPVEVNVNGRQFMEDARPDGDMSGRKELELTLDVTRSLHYDPEWENWIEVIPSNESGELHGRGGRPRSAKTRKTSGDPRFYALIAGVSEYAGDIKLKFASKDAKAFAAAVEAAANGLFGADKSTIHLLHDEGTPATRDNVLKAMKALTQATRDDVVLIYFAGHGITAGAKDDYHFVTRDAKRLELDDSERASVTVSGEEIVTWMRDELSALKTVMILDTCNSGQMISGMVNARGGATQRARSLDDLKEKTGTFILAGSANGKPSYEATPFGQGLLTYSLLLAMSGAKFEDGRVDVQGLFGFAEEQVPLFAKDMRGVQRPQVAIPKASQSFVIGLMDDADRKKITLAKKRPIVMRTRFENPDTIDELDLTKAVHAAMRAHSQQPKTARFFFAETDSLPDAFRVDGRYEVDGDTLKVRVFVKRDKKLIKRFEVEGEKGKVDRLVTRVLQGLIDVVEG